MTRKPKLLEAGHTDEIYTPAYALKPLLPFIPKTVTRIWEPCWGTGILAMHLHSEGFIVHGGPSDDFLSTRCIYVDMIITNPPYSLKTKFLARAFEIGLPFAFLLPLTALEGRERGDMYRKHGIQLIIPNRRVNFITPNGGTSSWFQTAWFTYGLNLAKDLNFVEMKRE